jgi:Tfp pilus assembly protein FimT
VVVVVLIAGLLSVSIPSMRGTFERSRLRAASREMVSLLRYARAAAVVKACRVILYLDPTDNRYRLRVLDTTTEKEARSRAERRKQEAQEWRDLPEKVRFERWQTTDEPEKDTRYPRIFFYPDGSAASAWIQLINEQGQRMTIEIVRATGAVKTYEGAFQAETPTEEEEFPEETPPEPGRAVEGFRPS